MPTYDYVCDACDHAFEQFQSITADPLKKCPQCAKRSLRRLMGTGGGIIFKGSGFYHTDYRSESYKQAAEAEKKGGETTKPADAAKAGESAKSGGDKAGAPAASGAPATKSDTGGKSSSAAESPKPSSSARKKSARK